MKAAGRVVPGALVLAAATFVVLAGAVSAQTSAARATFMIGDCEGLDGDLLVPESSTARCPNEARLTGPPGSHCSQTLRYRFLVTDAPGYADAKVRPSEFTESYEQSPPPSEPEHDVKTEVWLSVTTDRAAPAFEDGLYEVRMEVESVASPTGCGWGPGQFTGQVLVKNGFFALFRSDPGAAIQWVKAGETATLRFPVESISNGPLLVTATFGQEDEGGVRLTGIPGPASVRLAAGTTEPAEEARLGRIEVPIDIPAAKGETYHLVANLVGEFDGQTSRSDLPTHEEAVLRILDERPGNEPLFVPAPSVALVLSAIAAVTVALTRRAKSQ